MGRRGPQPKPGPREPNGRLKRNPDPMAKLNAKLDQEERENLRPGIEARVRVHNIPPEASRDQRAGSFVGRLCMGQELSTRQYEAAMAYLEDHRNNLIAIKAPKQPGAVDLNRVQGNSLKQENVKFSKASTARWKAVCGVIRSREVELCGHGAIRRALTECVEKDVEAHHLVGWLREGLNALAKFYNR